MGRVVLVGHQSDLTDRVEQQLTDAKVEGVSSLDDVEAVVDSDDPVACVVIDATYRDVDDVIGVVDMCAPDAAVIVSGTLNPPIDPTWHDDRVIHVVPTMHADDIARAVRFAVMLRSPIPPPPLHAPSKPVSPPPTGAPALASVRDASDAIAAIWLRARGALADHAAAIEAAVADAILEQASEEALSEAQRLAHRIAGTAGTFGAHRASLVARELEQLFIDRTIVGQGEVAARLVVELQAELGAVDAATETMSVAAGDVVLVRCDDPVRRRDVARSLASLGIRAATWNGEQLDVSPWGAVVDLASRRETDAIEQVRAANPRAHIFALVPYDDQAVTRRLLAVGATAILPATMDANTLAQTISRGYGVRESPTTPDLSTVPPGLDSLSPTHDVVLVEDDDLLADLLTHALSNRGLTVARIQDGPEAIATLVSSPPELVARVVLLDIDLPGASGLDVLTAMRAANTLDATRVIVVTARHSEHETLAALESGAFDHVAKPFSLPVLLARVDRALER